ncbi:MAG: glycosyltransferase, partial [Pseudomonadota bacterium]
MDIPPLAHVDIKWQRLAQDAVTLDCVVVLPTFKRPDHVKATLASVLGQKTQRTFAVIIMDNHPEGAEGAAAVIPMMDNSDHAGVVLLALRRGNCAAYNAGFRTALALFETARHILIIDDDEIAPPHWMEKLLDRAEATDSDCTGAPQTPIFDPGSDSAMAAHAVFRPPFESGGRVPILYSSGNV